jgi:hypothetical protein
MGNKTSHINWYKCDNNIDTQSEQENKKYAHLINVSKPIDININPVHEDLINVSKPIDINTNPAHEDPINVNRVDEDPINVNPVHDNLKTLLPPNIYY